MICCRKHQQIQHRQREKHDQRQQQQPHGEVDHTAPIHALASNGSLVSRIATPKAIAKATTASILPVLRRFESFLLFDESNSSLAFAAALVRTGWPPCRSFCSPIIRSSQLMATFIISKFCRHSTSG